MCCAIYCQEKKLRRPFILFWGHFVHLILIFFVSIHPAVMFEKGLSALYHECVHRTLVASDTFKMILEIIKIVFIHRGGIFSGMITELGIGFVSLRLSPWQHRLDLRCMTDNNIITGAHMKGAKPINKKC